MAKLQQAASKDLKDPSAVPLITLDGPKAKAKAKAASKTAHAAPRDAPDHPLIRDAKIAAMRALAAAMGVSVPSWQSQLTQLQHSLVNATQLVRNVTAAAEKAERAWKSRERLAKQSSRLKLIAKLRAQAASLTGESQRAELRADEEEFAKNFEAKHQQRELEKIARSASRKLPTSGTKPNKLRLSPQAQQQLRKLKASVMAMLARKRKQFLLKFGKAKAVLQQDAATRATQLKLLAAQAESVLRALPPRQREKEKKRLADDRAREQATFERQQQAKLEALHEMDLQEQESKNVTKVVLAWKRTLLTRESQRQAVVAKKAARRVLSQARAELHTKHVAFTNAVREKMAARKKAAHLERRSQSIAAQLLQVWLVCYREVTQ